MTAKVALLALERETKKLATSRSRQHELMRQAHGAGASLRDIAAVAGVNHETVRTIVRDT